MDWDSKEGYRFKEVLVSFSQSNIEEKDNLSALAKVPRGFFNVDTDCSGCTPAEPYPSSALKN